jgi:hypothetical protein
MDRLVARTSSRIGLEGDLQRILKEVSVGTLKLAVWSRSRQGFVTLEIDETAACSV